MTKKGSWPCAFTFVRESSFGGRFVSETNTQNLTECPIVPLLHTCMEQPSSCSFSKEHCESIPPTLTMDAHGSEHSLIWRVLLGSAVFSIVSAPCLCCACIDNSKDGIHHVFTCLPFFTWVIDKVLKCNGMSSSRPHCIFSRGVIERAFLCLQTIFNKQTEWRFHAIDWRNCNSSTSNTSRALKSSSAISSSMSMMLAAPAGP